MVEAVDFNILNLLVLLTLAWIFGLASERLGYPALMGELLAGIVFGPALLGILQPSAALNIFAEFGVFLLMIYVGMEVDLDDLFDLGPQAVMVAIGGFILPFGLGYLAGGVIGATLEQSLFIGIAMAATSLATKSRILVDLDLLDTRIASVLLGGALLSDVGVLIVFTGIMGFIETGEVDPLSIGLIAVEALLFFAVVLSIGHWILPHVWDRLERWMRRHEFVGKTSGFTVALVIALTFAYLAALVDLHMIIGGFVAGLFLRQAELHPDIYEHIDAVIYDLAMGLFAPIFFVTVAFDLTLEVFTTDLGLLLFILAIAFIGKLAGCWMFGVPTKLTSRESFVVGLGMNGRGTVEIIIVRIALEAGIIGQNLFSILVFMAIFTTALVPPTVKWGVDWLDRADELFYTREPVEDDAESV